jgi:hypothetical protein
VGRSSARAAARLTALASRPGWPGRGRPGASPAPGARGRASGAQGVRPPGWTGPAPGGHVRFAGPPGELHKPNRRPVSLWCTAWLVTPRRAASCCQDQPVARALATCRPPGPRPGRPGRPPRPARPRVLAAGGRRHLGRLAGAAHPWRQSTLTPAGASTNIDSPALAALPGTRRPPAGREAQAARCRSVAGGPPSPPPLVAWMAGMIDQASEVGKPFWHPVAGPGAARGRRAAGGSGPATPPGPGAR